MSSGVECFRTVLVAFCVKMESHRKNVIIAIGVVAGQNLLRIVIERFHHEENSDDECDRWNQEANVLEGRVRTRSDLRSITRIKDYVATIVHDYSGRQTVQRTFSNE